MEKLEQVVLVELGKEARITKMDLSLESMQKTVGGLIQAIYPWNDNVTLVCNDEGKLMGLPLCRALMRFDNIENYGPGDDFEVMDAIAGTFFICGLGEDDLTGLDDDRAKRYCERFLWPENFFWVMEKHNAIVLPWQSADLNACLRSGMTVSFIGPYPQKEENDGES